MFIFGAIFLLLKIPASCVILLYFKYTPVQWKSQKVKMRLLSNS